MSRIKKMVFIALLGTVGAVLGYIESMFPLPFPVPGLRLGLSNIVVLITLCLFGFKEGISVALIKSALVMLVTGQVSSFMYSACGASLACLSMYACLRLFKDGISLIGVSVVGAFFHNLGQVAVAALIIMSYKMFAYLPVLEFIGIFTGIFVGLAARFIIDKLKSTSTYF